MYVINSFSAKNTAGFGEFAPAVLAYSSHIVLCEILRLCLRIDNSIQILFCSCGAKAAGSPFGFV